MNSTIKLTVAAFAVCILVTACKKEEEAAVADTPQEIILPRVQPIPTGNYVAPQPQQQAQPQQQLNQPQMANQAQQQVVTKPGMNPPHGQAGHRCDLQVGAPLNSKPAPPAPAATSGKTITQQVTPTAPSSNVPALLQPTAAKTVTPAGMNPPHGEEGHQCSVAVGAPLPK
jgi:hypothetical protein